MMTSSVSAIMIGKSGSERRVRLAGVLDVAAGLDPVAGGKLGDERRQRLADLHGDLRRLQSFVDIALHRDRRRAVAPSQDRVSGADLDLADLARAESGWPSWLVRVRSPSRAGSRRSGPAAARDHIDGPDILPHLSDGTPVSRN